MKHEKEIKRTVYVRNICDVVMTRSVFLNNNRVNLVVIGSPGKGTVVHNLSELHKN